MTTNKAHVIKPDNLLLENCMSIFHIAMPLVSGDRGASVAQDLREKFTRTFSEFERHCFELQLDAGMINDVKYAIAAFVDEKVMSSAWPHKLTWMGKPLQLEYFGDNLAGEEFFNKLNKLRQGGDRNIDGLEVFFLCLQLGFEGMYRMRGLEQLQALQVDLRTQIADSRNRVPRTLSPHGVVAGSFMEKVQRDLPYWAIVAITVAIIFLTYLIFIVLLSNKANAARVVLQDDGQRITKNLEIDATQRSQPKPVMPVVYASPKIASPGVAPPPVKPANEKSSKPKKKKRPVPKPVPKPVETPAPKPVEKPKENTNTWLIEHGFAK